MWHDGMFHNPDPAYFLVPSPDKRVYLPGRGPETQRPEFWEYGSETPGGQRIGFILTEHPETRSPLHDQTLDYRGRCDACDVTAQMEVTWDMIRTSAIPIREICEHRVRAAMTRIGCCHVLPFDKKL